MPESSDSATAQMQGLRAPEESQDPGAARDVFVSYASSDAAVATAAVAALERHGLTCWIAPRDVMPGSLYADGIVRAINAAKVFALVLSEHAVASAHVGKEIERASSKRRPIIALRTDLAPLTPAFEYFLSESQWIDVGAGGMDAAAAKLVDAVRRLISSPSGVNPAHGVDSAEPPAAKLATTVKRPALALIAVVASRWRFSFHKLWLPSPPAASPMPRRHPRARRHAGEAGSRRTRLLLRRRTPLPCCRS